MQNELLEKLREHQSEQAAYERSLKTRPVVRVPTPVRIPGWLDAAPVGVVWERMAA